MLKSFPQTPQHLQTKTSTFTVKEDWMRPEMQGMTEPGKENTLHSI